MCAENGCKLKETKCSFVIHVGYEGGDIAEKYM